MNALSFQMHLKSMQFHSFQTVYSSEPIFVYTLKPKPSMAAMDQAKLVAKEDRVTAAKRKDVSKQITYFRTTNDDETKTLTNISIHHYKWLRRIEYCLHKTERRSQ